MNSVSVFWGVKSVVSGFNKLSNCGFDKLATKKCTLYIHKDFRGGIGLQTCGNNTAGVQGDIFERSLLADEEQLHKKYHPSTVRSSKFTSVYKFGVSFGGAEKVVYLKEYFCRSWLDFVKHFFRSSRARRSLEATLMLQEKGFDVPVVVAMGECRTGFFKKRNFLVSLGAENAKRLYEYIANSGEKLSGRQLRKRRRLIRAFGRTVGRMHAKGIFHGDLRLGNVLVREDGDDWRFFFLDNERTRRFRRLPGRLRLKNLVQINMFEPWLASDADRMRFFKEYWAENKKSGAEKAVLIKEVLEKTKRRLRKKMGASA